RLTIDDKSWGRHRSSSRQKSIFFINPPFPLLFLPFAFCPLTSDFCPLTSPPAFPLSYFHEIPVFADTPAGMFLYPVGQLHAEGAGTEACGIEAIGPGMRGFDAVPHDGGMRPLIWAELIRRG